MPRMRRRSRPITPSVIAAARIKNITLKTRFFRNLLENTLALIKIDPAENVPLLAPMLDIPLPSDRELDLSPEELRRRQLGALTAWALVSARVQPVVLACEDLHWADPTTLDVLRGIDSRRCTLRRVRVSYSSASISLL